MIPDGRQTLIQLHACPFIGRNVTRTERRIAGGGRVIYIFTLNVLLTVRSNTCRLQVLIMLQIAQKEQCQESGTVSGRVTKI